MPGHSTLPSWTYFMYPIDYYEYLIGRICLMTYSPSKYMTDRDCLMTCCAMCVDFVTSRGRSELAVYWQALAVAERFALNPHTDLTERA